MWTTRIWCTLRNRWTELAWCTPQTRCTSLKWWTLRTVAMTGTTHRMHMCSNMMHWLDMIGLKLISELFVSSRKAFQEYGYTISILLQASFGKHICRSHSVTTRMEGCRLQVESNYVLEGCTMHRYRTRWKAAGNEGHLCIRRMHRYRIRGTIIHRNDTQVQNMKDNYISDKQGDNPVNAPDWLPKSRAKTFLDSCR